MIVLRKLFAPFPGDKVHWRVGATNREKTKGLALAYIDARDVMERLDDVCGFENWQRRYVDAGNGRTCCEVGIRCADNEWVWKSDGAGDTDVEGDKGAFSDSFKRAAVNWGVGRYLYDMPATWVELEKKGSSYVIAPGALKRLQGSRAHAPANQSEPEHSAEEIEKIAGALSDALQILLRTNPSRNQLVEWREQNNAQISVLTPKLREALWAVYEPALKKAKELEAA